MQNFLLILFVLLGAGCQTDPFYATKKLMKNGQLNETIAENITLQSNFEQANDNSCGFYTIKVQLLPDTTTYNFLIDTGSPTVISPKIAQKLRLKTLATYQDNLYENHPIFHITQLAAVKLPTTSKKLPSLVFQNIAAVVDSFSQASYLATYDGILGANLMQHAIWQFDGRGKQINLLAPQNSQQVAKTNKALPFFRNIYRVPKFHAFINDYQMKQVFCLSTGFGGGIKIPSAEWHRCHALGIDSAKQTKEIANFCQKNYMLYKDANEQKDTLRSLSIDKFKADTIQKQQLQALFAAGNSWVVGNDLLKHFVVVIDWKQRKFYLCSEAN
jgi:hypothetical protein